MRTGALSLAAILCLSFGCTKQTKQDPTPDDEVLFAAPKEDAVDSGEPAPFELYTYGATNHQLVRFLAQTDKERAFILADRAPLRPQQRVYRAEDLDGLEAQVLSELRCTEDRGVKLCTTAPSLPPGQPGEVAVGTPQDVNLDLELVGASNLLQLFSSVVAHQINVDLKSATRVFMTISAYRVDARLLVSQLLWLTEASTKQEGDALAVAYTTAQASPNADREVELPRVFRTCGDQVQNAGVFTCTDRNELSLVAVMVTPGEQPDAPFYQAMLTCNGTFGVIQREGSMDLSMGEGCTMEERVGFRVAKIEKDRVQFIALEDENRRFEIRASR